MVETKDITSQFSKVSSLKNPELPSLNDSKGEDINQLLPSSNVNSRFSYEPSLSEVNYNRNNVMRDEVIDIIPSNIIKD